MSSKTKIIVLKSKELIYTGIFVILGIILIVLLIYMFSPANSKDKSKSSITSETSAPNGTTTTYKPGVYTSVLNLGGSTMELSVTVDKTNIAHVEITNLNDTVTAMYPLLEPSLEEINKEIATVSSLSEITYSGDNKYTSIIILEAIEDALEDAVIIE